MKKGLLIFAAAIMVAMGVNAQNVRISHSLEKNVSAETVMMEKVASAASNVVEPQHAFKVSASGSIAGTYILETGDEIYETSTFTIEEAKGSIVLDMYAEEGKETPTFNYNIIMRDFSYPGAVIYASYDSEESQIFIPVQTISTHATYKEIVISGAHLTNGGANISYGSELILDVDEDGSMTVNPNLEEGDKDEDATTGFVNFLPNYEDGGFWNFGFNLSVLVPNATMSYVTTGKKLGGTGSDWASVKNIPVYYEDMQEEALIHNFLTKSTVSVTLGEEGKCYIPFGQPLYDNDFSDDNFEYGYINIVGCVLDGNGIKTDFDVKQLNGFYNEKGLEFYKVTKDESDGKYYYDDDDPDYCRYFNTCSKFDDEGSGYGWGFVCNMSVNLAYFTAINDINATKNTSKMTYNLMGQKVNSSAKGLVIRDGKKFIVK